MFVALAAFALAQMRMAICWRCMHVCSSNRMTVKCKACSIQAGVNSNSERLENLG